MIQLIYKSKISGDKIQEPSSDDYNNILKEVKSLGLYLFDDKDKICIKGKESKLICIMHFKEGKYSHCSFDTK